MLTILLGDYGSGKTRTAKYLAEKNGGVYLDIDQLAGTVIANYLKALLFKGQDYYLDGWNGQHYNGRLSEMLETEVKYIVCMADPLKIIERQKKKASHVQTKLPRSNIEIWTILHVAASVALSYDEKPMFADTTVYPPKFFEKTQWMPRWMEINLYSMLDGKGEYQDVELSDKYITGLSKSYKTWERLETLIDFKGKAVLDYGCNYGYFCFKAESASASSIIGIDVSSSVINTANSIGITKNSKCQFLTAELKDYKPAPADVILALNTLHHVNYHPEILKRIFKAARTVVLELPELDIVTVDRIAKLYGFGYPVLSNSHREGRVIAVYSHLEKQPVVLKKYVYHRRRETVKWWLIRNGAKFFPGSIKRRLWSLFR